MNPRPIALLWSGGKDSALALRELRESPDFEVRVLLTTMARDSDRISIHGVRRELLEAQTVALGVPLQTIELPANCSNERYEGAFSVALRLLRNQGIHYVAAGDLFLQDVRDYRAALLNRHGIEAEFPLWKRDTTELAREFIGAGFRAILSCVDTQALDSKFAGRDFDERLLRDLPPQTDPCGENGEFHSFVWDGPGFARPIKCERGEVVLRDQRFAFCDIVERQTEYAAD